MTVVKQIVLGLVVAVVVFGGAWLALFGTQDPCDALRAQIPEVLKAETPNVRKQVIDASKEWSGLTCAGAAIRIRLGDRKVLVIIK